MPRSSTKARAIALVVLCALAAAVAAARLRRDPAIPWLDGAGPARWIVYPSPARTDVRAIVPLEASFERSFRLDATPARALLRFRAFTSGIVRINGRDALVVGGPDWKTERTAEVAALLRAGENVVEARVLHASGPPALWLALELPGETVASDERWTSSWAGAAPRAASPAAAPRSARPQDPDGRVPAAWTALALEAPRVLIFALLAAAGAGGVVLLRRVRPGWPVVSPGSRWPSAAAVAAAALAWTALFANDAPWLPPATGFDALAHLEYAQFLLDRRAVPFADEGWQMFQPPLYYLLLAAGCAAAGVSPLEPGAVAVVRGLGLAIGVVHLGLVAACLRLLFPGRPGRQVAGILLAGFAPCMLYLHQYPANEPLLAMLSSAAVLVCLRLLARGDAPLPLHAGLGVVLGLALLAKVSALLLVAPLLGALAARALAGGSALRARRLAGIALALGALGGTAGWYYARVWARFGTPFVGGWDPRRGMGWWSDPGYHTAGDLLRFGRAFAAPLFAGLGGIWDGLYVTVFGDGLLSGRVSVALVPPWWSPSLMSASLLLAAVPAAAVLAGGGAALVRWVRRPDAATGMLVSLAAVAVASLPWMAVTVPAASAAKGSYALLALVPFCAFGARALGALATAPWRRLAAAAAVGAWAMTSFAAYWIDGSSGKARVLRGTATLERGEAAEGLALLRDAVARAPRDWPTRVLLAGHLLQAGGPREEIVGLLAPGEEVPGLAARHLALAALALRDGDAPGAERALRSALAADPDDVHAHLQLAQLRAAAGDPRAAVGELREVLRIDPQHRVAHVSVAALLDRLGERERARMHRMWVARLDAAR